MSWQRIGAASLVFFCTIGWVCNTSVIGAEPTGRGASDSGGIFAPTPAEDAVHADSPELPEGQTVSTGQFGEISIHVKDLDLTQVLQLLSIQSQRNIVASRNVTGTVSADLYGVDFYEALDAILTAQGYGYREKGNFIFVYTAAELQAIEDAERRPISRVYRLNYLTAEDAATFATPHLSAVGTITANGSVDSSIKPSESLGGANEWSHAETLVIRDYEENVEEITGLLNELDVRPSQVLIEATVLSASLTEDNALGVDFTGLIDFGVSQFPSGPLSAAQALIDDGASANDSGGAISTSFGRTQFGAAGVKAGIVTDNFAAFVRALNQITDVTVVANPKLLVLNRQRAELLIGERLGYISTTVAENTVTETVQFLEVGTTLTVRPFVSDDGYIRLELIPSISSGDVAEVGELVIPNTSEETLQTNVLVRNKQTVVLGGLFSEATSVSRNQYPGLGDVPVIGAAFRGKDAQFSRSETIFMIRPTIAEENKMAEIGEQTRHKIDQVRLGARKGLLPWSRTKLAASHLRAARRWMDEGQTERALWSVRMALQADPNLHEAQRLHEELSGEAMTGPTNSVLESVIDEVLRGEAPADAAAGRDGRIDFLAGPERAGDPRNSVVVKPSPAPQPEPAAAPEAAPAEVAEADEPVADEPVADEPVAEVEITPVVDEQPVVQPIVDVEPEPAQPAARFEFAPEATPEQPVNEPVDEQPRAVQPAEQPAEEQATSAKPSQDARDMLRMLDEEEAQTSDAMFNSVRRMMGIEQGEASGNQER